MEVDTHMAGLRFVELPVSIKKWMTPEANYFNEIQKKKTFLSYVVSSN
jgi:hypothetical protein